MSTRSYVRNSSPVSFFLAVLGSHSLMRSVALRKILGVLVTEAAEQQGTAATRMIGVAHVALLCSRSCCSRLFLSLAFCFVSWSSQRVCKNAVIINVSHGSGWEGLVGVKRSVSSISHELSSFLGAPGAFVSCASFSSFSSASASPKGRVRDWDRRELSGSCVCCCCCCLWRGVTCVAGIAVVNPKDSEGWDCILGWVCH